MEILTFETRISIDGVHLENAAARLDHVDGNIRQSFVKDGQWIPSIWQSHLAVL